MKTQKLVFVTSNPYKVAEARSIGREFNFSVESYDLKIDELQTEDTSRLIRAKTLCAFSSLRLPVIVDHAGLHMDCLEGLPGNLTQLFWDRLGADGLCEIAANRRRSGARAVTTVAYCDTKRIHTFDSYRDGYIAKKPKGTRKFQWDTIFVPDGHAVTYAQMKISDKNIISQRGQAFRQMFEYIVSKSD